MILAAGTDPAKRISEIRKRTHQYWFLVGGNATPTPLKNWKKIRRIQLKQEKQEARKTHLQTAAYMSILWEATYRGKFLYRYSYKIG